jgi:hypothetical protein
MQNFFEFKHSGQVNILRVSSVLCLNWKLRDISN